MLVKNKAQIPLGIVVDRRDMDNPWQDCRWEPVAVIPGAGPLAPDGPWTVLNQGDGWERYHAGTLPLELFAGETEAYKTNLSQDPPRLFVVLRSGEDQDSQHEIVPFLVTASAYEAQDYLDSGEDVVEPVVMPEAVVAFVQRYVDKHHVEQTFYKRKRQRADTGDESFARRPRPGRRHG